MSYRDVGDEDVVPLQKMLGVTAAIVLFSVAGCADTSPSGAPVLPLPSVSSSVPSSEMPSVSPSYDGDGLQVPDENSTAEDIMRLYEGREAPPSVDPTLSAAEQARMYEEYLNKQKSAALYKETINGVEYSIVAVGNDAVGPDSPLRLGVIPASSASSAVKLTKPILSQMNVVVSSDANMVSDVTCTPLEVLREPVVVTCSFKKEVPDGTQLWFGFVIDKENQRLIQIPLNSQGR